MGGRDRTGVVIVRLGGNRQQFGIGHLVWWSIEAA
jgi:hypothetical protein